MRGQQYSLAKVDASGIVNMGIALHLNDNFDVLRHRIDVFWGSRVIAYFGALPPPRHSDEIIHMRAIS